MLDWGQAGVDDNYRAIIGLSVLLERFQQTARQQICRIWFADLFGPTKTKLAAQRFNQATSLVYSILGWTIGYVRPWDDNTGDFRSCLRLSA